MVDTEGRKNEDQGLVPQEGKGRLNALDPFKTPLFTAIWFTSLLSNIGTLVQATAAAWLMTTLSTSPQLVALVQTALTLPVVLFALPAGVIADMFDRRRVLLIALVFMFVSSATMAVCAILGVINPVTLLTLVFIVGCGTALYGPAWQTSIRDIVPTYQVPAAVGLNSLGFNFARTAGPAIGGLLVGAVGAASAFAVNTMTYIFLIGALYGWKPKAKAVTERRQRFGIAIVDGVTHVLRSEVATRLLLRVVLFGVASMSVPALAPLVVRDSLQQNASVYGLLLAGFGVGAMAGSIACVSLRQRWNTDLIVRVASLVFAAATLCIALSASVAPAMVGFFLGGAAWSVALPSLNVSLQLSAPAWLVGRTMGIYQTCLYGAGALAGWIWGEAAAHLGLTAALIMSAAVHVPNMLLGTSRG